MKILAILQNQWFKDPDRIAAIYARHADDLDYRARLNARYLFCKSLTGRRLKAAFGDLCDSIVWEEASPQVGGRSSSAFRADIQHIKRLVDHHQPEVIIAFGKIAQDGVWRSMAIQRRSFMLFGTVHPAARGNGTVRTLAETAANVRAYLARCEAA